MKSLEKVLNEIENILKEDFNIFITTDSLEEISESVEYYSPDGDWEKFIEIPRKLQIPIIYIFYLTGEDLHLKKYKNDIGLIEIGFYYNNIMHIFRMTTDWYDDYEIYMDEDEEYME